ncbi:MAG: DUF5118 domain-containing protein [Bacteroidota bacterium]
MKKSLLTVLAVLLMVGTSLHAQEGEAAKGKRSKGPKSFSEVVTADAEMDEGLFTVHKEDGNY